MNHRVYKALRRLAIRSPWWLARRLYPIAFAFLDRHNRAFP